MIKFIFATVFLTFLSAGHLWAEEDISTTESHTFFELGDTSEHVRFVCFSPDSKKIVTTGRKYISQIWDAESGNELKTLDAELVERDSRIQGHYPSKLTSAAFSPDGKRIATVSLDDAIRIWDVESGKILQTFVGHGKTNSSRGVISVAFSPDGKKIATAAWDGTARIWDAESGNELQKLVHPTVYWINSATFSSDGTKLLTHTHTDSIVRIWDVNTGEMLHELKGFTGHVRSAIFSPNGKKVIAVGAAEDGNVRIWDADSGSELLKLSVNSIDKISISQDGNLMATVTGAPETAVRIWDANTGDELQTLKDQSGDGYAMLSADISPDGKSIVTMSNYSGGVVRIWDTHTGKILQTLEARQRGMFAVRFSPDGKKIVVTSGDRHHGNVTTTRIWNLK